MRQPLVFHDCLIIIPALLTQEGIRGDENSPDAFHNTVLPFTRFLAGPADFTFCFPNPTNSFSKNIKVSKAQQLALTVVYFSPLQAIFWYGKPTDYGNAAGPENWQGTIVLDFLQKGKHIRLPSMKMTGRAESVNERCL